VKVGRQPSGPTAAATSMSSMMRLPAGRPVTLQVPSLLRGDGCGLVAGGSSPTLV
jgi:hypothetical protein